MIETKCLACYVGNNCFFSKKCPSEISEICGLVQHYAHPIMNHIEDFPFL